MKKIKYGGKVFDKRTEAAAFIAEDMTSKDPITRSIAIGELTKLSKEALQYTPAFVQALTDEDRSVRYWAIIWLAGLEALDTSYLSAVAALLSDPDPGIRFYAVETLGAQGLAAAEYSETLSQLLGESDPHVRFVAAKALMSVDPQKKESIAELQCKFFKDADDEPLFRESAIKVLGLLGLAGLQRKDRLISALNDRYGPVRLAAANSLRLLGAEAVMFASSDLAKVCHMDSKPDVREAAHKALKLVDLAAAIEHESRDIRRWAVQQMTSLGTEAAGYASNLAKALKDDDPEMRYYAAMTFSIMGPSAAEFAFDLQAALSDSHFPVHKPAMESIVRNIPGSIEDSLSVFLALLKDPKPEVREDAAVVIGAARGEALKHVPLLVELFDDELTNVRLAAVRAVASIGQYGVRKADRHLARLAKSDKDYRIRCDSLHLLRHYMLAAKFGLADM